MASCNCKIYFAWQCSNCDKINTVECKLCKRHYIIRILEIPWESKK